MNSPHKNVLSSNDKVGKKESALKRLQKELMELVMSDDKSISAFPEGENLFSWIATIIGPKDTVYDNITFRINLVFSSNYPFKPPSVKFINRCFHPNISESGEICLDILKENWSALYGVRTILLSIQSLLGEPNLKSPLNSSAASTWGHKNYKHLVLESHRHLTTKQ